MSAEDIRQFIRDNDAIQDFLNEACMIHEDVNQKYDTHPYAYHVRNVVNQAITGLPSLLGDDTRYVAVVLFGAAFHDTIEDARLTYNDVLHIANRYMPEEDALMATEIVYALTNEKGRTRAERANDKYYEGIRHTPFAPFVKYCDRMANMAYSRKKGQHMLTIYEEEMPHFMASLTGDDCTAEYGSIPSFTPAEDLPLSAKLY